MQIREDVYNWLVSLRVIANDGKRYHDKVEINQQTVNGFESGLLFAKLLRELSHYYFKATKRPETPMSKLDTLKEVTSAASRHYNWKILIEEYQKIGVNIDQDTKGLILGGDSEMIHELLKEIYTQAIPYSGTSKISQSYADLGLAKLSLDESMMRSPLTKSTKSVAQLKQATAQQQVDLSKLEQKKDLAKSSNCLEFLIIALSKHLQLNTKQTATLFTNNNKYLAHVIAKGAKGVFEPIIAFYQDVYANSSLLVKLFVDDSTKKSMVFTLQALKAGIISKSIEVAQWTTKLYTKLASDFQQNNTMIQAWEWFIEEGLSSALMGIKRHPDLRDQLTNMILQFARFNFMEVFTNGLKKACPQIPDQIYSIEQLIKPLAENKLSRDEFVNSGLLDEWIHLALSTAEGEYKNPVDVRIASLAILTEIWMLFPQKIEEIEQRASLITSLLKRGSRDRSQSLSLCALNDQFKLLNFFGAIRNNYAPMIYKSLALTLVENHQNSITREFILNNFVSTFQKNESIPFSVLIEPLIKQIQMSENVTYIINTFDIQFFQAIASTDRLGIKNAIQLLDLLAKVFLNSNVYAATAQDIIINVLSRHIDNATMQEFILKFIKISLAMFYASEKNKKPKPPPGKKSEAYSNQDVEKEVLQAQKRAQIVEIIRTIVQLQQIPLNDKIKPLVAHTNIQIKQFSKKNQKGMLVILSLFGNPDKIIEQYEIDFHNQQARLKLEEEQGLAQSLVNYSSLSSLKQTSADPKTLIQLESIKKNFMEKVHSKVTQEEEMKELAEKQKKSLRKQLEKRAVEQGVPTLNHKNVEAKLLFKDGQREKELNNEKKHGLPEFELTDLDLEEERDKLLVEMELRKYHKILKYLFLKYANTGHTNKKYHNFNEYQDRSDTISLPELWLFAKDFQLDTQVPKDEIPALVRAIQVQILKNKTELQVFYFDGFKHFLVQFAILVHGHSQRDLRKYCSPVSALQKLFKHMRNVSAAKGQNTSLWDDPDQQFFQESDVIKEYNKKLLADPKFLLPEGYKAVKEPQLHFRNELPAGLKLEESQEAAYEAINDILNKVFGFSLIEPITQKDVITVCRPNMLGHVKSKVKDRLKNGPLYLDYEKNREEEEQKEKQKKEEEEKKRQEWEESIRQRKVKREKDRLAGKKEKADPKYTKQILDRYTHSAGVGEKRRVLEIDSFHKATPGMRLGISKVAYKDRGIAEQVALLLDDVLNAVDTNRPTIDRHIPIINKVMQAKEEKMKFDKESIEKNQEKFDKIKRFMKKRLEAIRARKEKEKPEKEKKQKEENDKKEAEKKKQEDFRKNRLDKLKQKIQTTKQKEEEERIKKEQDDRDKKIRELEEKKKKFQEFNKSMLEKYKTKKELKDKLKEEKLTKQTEKEKKHQEILQKLYQLIEKKGAHIQQKEKETQQTISQRFQDGPYQEVFKRHNFKLSYFFELLQMEFYHPIEFADNKDFIPLKIWMWFGERFNIYPEVFKMMDFVRVFNYLTHNKQTGKKPKKLKDDPQGQEEKKDKKDQSPPKGGQKDKKAGKKGGKDDPKDPKKDTKKVPKKDPLKDQEEDQDDDQEREKEKRRAKSIMDDVDWDADQREKHPKLKPPVGLNYLEFLQALLRVSIKGANVFNKIAEKIKQGKGKVSQEEMDKIIKEEQDKKDEEKREKEEGKDKKDDDGEGGQPKKRQHQTKEEMLEQIKKDKQIHDQNLKEAMLKLKEDAKLEKKALLLDNYKYMEESTPQTLEALIYYLGLPDDKVGIELRFRKALQDQQTQVTDKERKKQLIAKLEEDLDKWQKESKLPRTKSPGKAVQKKQRPKLITEREKDKKDQKEDHKNDDDNKDDKDDKRKDQDDDEAKDKGDD